MNKREIVNNLMWRFMERCGAQAVTLIVSIILARLLDPNDYGTISLILVFVSILEVFIDSGLGNALIQKKDADDLDFSSVFYFNFWVCVFLYVIMFISAPIIADFYNNVELIALIRVMSITLIISGIRNIQQAYISRNMLFKKFFAATMCGTSAATPPTSARTRPPMASGRSCGMRASPTRSARTSPCLRPRLAGALRFLSRSPMRALARMSPAAFARTNHLT